MNRKGWVRLGKEPSVLLRRKKYLCLKQGERSSAFLSGKTPCALRRELYVYIYIYREWMVRVGEKKRHVHRQKPLRIHSKWNLQIVQPQILGLNDWDVAQHCKGDSILRSGNLFPVWLILT